MVARILLALAALLVIALGSARAGDAAASPAEFVLVWQNAWLYTAANEEAPKARARTWGDEERLDRFGQVWAFELRSLKGSWAEIGSIEDKNLTQCAHPLFDLSDYRLRLFVKAKDLAPVLTRAVNARFADGTGFTLQAGLPVGPQPEKAKAWRTVQVEDFLFEVPVPEASVGTSYRIPTRITLMCQNDWIMNQAKYSYDSTRSMRKAGDWNSPCVASLTQRKKDAMVTLQSRCAELKVRAVGHTRRSGLKISSLYGRLPEQGLGQEWRVVRKDHQVFWPDGSEAGTVRRDLMRDLKELMVPVVQVSGMQLLCTGLALSITGTDAEMTSSRRGSDTERKLKVCFRAQDIETFTGPLPGTPSDLVPDP